MENVLLCEKVAIRRYSVDIFKDVHRLFERFRSRSSLKILIFGDSKI